MIAIRFARTLLVACCLLLVAGLVVSAIPSFEAAAAGSDPVVGSALVRRIDTSNWNPASPDPSGIAFHPLTGQLFVGDGEVDELPIFTGKNVFRSTTAGALQATCGTTAFSQEPTGVAVNPSNGHVFFSDDRERKIFEIALGPDGQYCTADDVVTWFSTSAFGNADPEGVAYGDGKVFVAGGAEQAVYVVSPGPNGKFDGVPPTADDTVTSFSTQALGIKDLEGIDYNPATGTLLLASRHTEENLVETTATGELIRVIEIASHNPYAPAGVAYGPGSTDPSRTSIYLVDRHIDNDFDPAENDGQVFEFSILEGPPPQRLSNAGFEYDDEPNGSPDRWSRDPRFTRSSEVVRSGSYAGKFAAGTGSSLNIGQTITHLAGGVTYTVTGWVNVPPTTDPFTFRIELQWRNADGSKIATERLKLYSGPTGGWDQAAATLVAPAGTDHARLTMVANFESTVIYVDDLVFAPTGAAGTPVPTATPTATSAVTPTATSAVTPTATPATTSTATPATTSTATPATTLTATPTATPATTSTATPTATPTAAPSGPTFAAEADAHVEEASPTTNFGTASRLQVDGSPRKQTYLRFAVSGLSGSVQHATLRLFVVDNTGNGPAIHATSNSWSESELTWDNRPAPSGSALDNQGAIPLNDWVEYDVSALVNGNGTYSFVLLPESNNGADFFARNGSNPPQLVLTTGAP